MQRNSRSGKVGAAVRGQPEPTANIRNENLKSAYCLGSSQEPANTRKGRGKARATMDLIEACREILEEIQPASVRAVCYRLFTMGLIPNMSKNATNAVSTQLVWAREAGLIPWGHVVDETRSPERASTWSNPDAIINTAVETYRRDHWQDQPAWVEVWSEKGTIRGTLAPVLDRFGVTFRVMHGYGSATSVYGIAEETRNNAKPLTILYAGDWDPSGLHMSEVDLPRRIERYSGNATIKRIALAGIDVGQGTDLPSFDAESKTKDPRHRWFVDRFGIRCWELDALSPVVLRQRFEEEIIAHLDVASWNRAIEVETVEMQSMRAFLMDWNSKSMQAPK